MDKFKDSNKNYSKIKEDIKVESNNVVIDEINDKIRDINLTIQKLDAKKSDIQDFITLKHSVDKNRAQEVFKDMQIYADGIMNEIQHRVNVDKEDTVTRINEVLQLLSERVLKDDFKKVINRVDEAEKYITKVVVNASVKEEKEELCNIESGIQKYLEQMQNYNRTIGRLERKIISHEDKLNSIFNNAKHRNHMHFKQSIQNINNFSNVLSLDGSQGEVRTIDISEDK